MLKPFPNLHATNVKKDVINIKLESKGHTESGFVTPIKGSKKFKATPKKNVKETLKPMTHKKVSMEPNCLGFRIENNKAPGMKVR
jgi:hypothetical protein